MADSLARRILLRFIGTLSGTAFGLAVATAIVQGGLYQFRLACLAIGLVIGAGLGFYVGNRMAANSDSRGHEGYRTLSLNVVFSLYHLGAVVLFAALFAWGSDYDLTWGYSGRRVFLELAILGYAFLRLWHLAAKIWARTIGEPPLFFFGLYLGTLPTLIFVMCQIEELKPLCAVLDPINSLLRFPLWAAEAFNFEYIILIREWSIYILAASLEWAFIFLLFDVLIIRRMARNET